MSRLKKEIRYTKRYKNIWYYKVCNGKWTSTGVKSKSEAIKIAEAKFKEPEEPDKATLSFLEYSKDFFSCEKCPRALRLEREGRRPTDRYLKIQRMNLSKHIHSSSFARKELKSIKRADVLKLREELVLKELKASTITKIMNAVKTIFSEAIFQEDIVNNPTLGVGAIREERSNIDIFTDKELVKLFNKEHYAEIWGDFKTYVCFYFAFNTGMRRGEVLALKWKHIHTKNKYISIEEAWKDVKTLGKPKSGKSRTMPISSDLIHHLNDLKSQSYTSGNDDLVFCYADGSRLGETWWKKKFDQALDRAGIEKKGRALTPHKLRHTLNTKLRNLNENPDKIREALGWSSEAIQDRYTHWKPEHFESLGKNIEEQISGIFKKL